MLDDKQKEILIKDFESKGIEKVKHDLALGFYGNRNDPSYPNACLAQVWIESKEAEASATIKAKELSLAQEANDVAKSANKLSRIAIWISVLSVLISAVITQITK